MSKTLMVYLAADTDKFRREMRQAENQVDNLGKQSGAMGGMVGNAGMMLGAAAAAAGAFAIKLGLDAVQAAMDEEAAVAKMNTTLANLGFGSSTDQVSAFIDELQYAYNVSDSDLRPAFERLAIATGSVSGAQKALRLALDVSAGSGKSLESVSNALGKAYEGNYGALGKLGTGLDKAILKSGDMDAITAELADTFDGQATVAANTLKGGLAGVKVATDELIEAFGTGLMDGITKGSGSVDDFEQTIKDMTETALVVGKFIGGALAAAFYQMSIQVRTLGTGVSYLDKAWVSLQYALGRISESEYKARIAAADANIAFNQQKIEVDALSLSQSVLGMFASDTNAAFDYQQYAAYNDRKALDDLGDGVDKQKDKQKGAAGAVKDTNTALDRQREHTQAMVDKLKEATGAVVEWTDKIKGYRDTLTTSLMGSINLGTAFEQSGEEGGLSLLAGFRAQLTNAENFAGLLGMMKASGASDMLIQAVAGYGPEMGSKLAKEMLDQGLVKTISDEWQATRDKIYETTSTIVPDFMIIGRDSAIELMQAAEDQVGKSEKKLRNIGQDIGEPIGATIKEKIAQAVAEAIAAAQAAAAALNVSVPVTTAPSASAGSGSTGGPAATGRATVTSLDTLITQNNARGGVLGSSSVVLA